MTSIEKILRRNGWIKIKFPKEEIGKVLPDYFSKEEINQEHIRRVRIYEKAKYLVLN